MPTDVYGKRVARELPVLDLPQSLGARLTSTNVKTGISINLPILATCEPSAVCRRVCYACAGWFVKPVVTKHAIAVLNYFRDTPTSEAAARVAREADSARTRFVRWNGSGDLIPETVAVINVLAVCRPDLTQVVYSRKPALVNLLTDDPAIVVNVSLDRVSLDLPASIARPNVRYTYLRESDDDVPPPWSPDLPIEVVFPVAAVAAHDPRDCGADAGRMPLAGACARCLRCYRPPSATAAIYAHAATVAVLAAD